MPQLARIFFFGIFPSIALQFTFVLFPSSFTLMKCCYDLFTFFSIHQGVPMIYMGDEYGHTKGGNNNTYCHDNYVKYNCIYSSLISLKPISVWEINCIFWLQINYFRWDKMEESSNTFFRFCCLMNKFRQ